ncbi:MAG: LuxR C-terminal-related transcriptional regulator [Dehalococcoidales bacterium]|nr:LuxR C-terminal-related transcriptional regulator [Dehalococcoidales bacterium]
MTKHLNLSARQHEVVWYTAHGLTAREVAEKMGAKEQTVKNFLYYARLKYHAANNAHLVFLYFLPEDITNIPVENYATNVRRLKE